MAKTEDIITRRQKREIEQIKHDSKKIWLNIVYNPLIYISVIIVVLMFVAIDWFYYWNHRAAIGQSAAFLIEFAFISWFKNFKKYICN